jgi:hypothetical protein
MIALSGVQAILPIIEVLERGISAAGEAAGHLLRGRALQLWQAALRSAPPEIKHVAGCQGAREQRARSHDGHCQGLRWQFVPRVGDGKNCFGRFGRSGGHPNSAVVGVASSIWLR